MKRFLLFIILFYASALTAQTSNFVKLDTTTQGNWPGVYGASGFVIEAGSSSSGPIPVFQGASTWTWTTGGTDIRALQNGSRIAACWYSSTNFYVDLTYAGQVDLYMLDWDTYQGGRNQTVQVTDAVTGALLSSNQITNFTNGAWLVLNISGHVHINIINNNISANAVLSGIFFDPAPSGQGITLIAGPQPHSVTLTWPASLNATGYNVYRQLLPNGTLQLLTPSPISALTFKDLTVLAGDTYTYSVTSVENGVESKPTPVTEFVIPSP